jgi:hypothetical protein
VLPSIGGGAASPAGADGTAQSVPEPSGSGAPDVDSEDAVIWAHFVRDYLLLLDERVATIRQRLDSGDERGADTALMSLQATSAMIGANELVAVVSRLRAMVGQRLHDELPDLAETLVAEAAAVRLRFGQPS